MENGMAVPQKSKNRTTTWSSHPTSRCIHKRWKQELKQIFVHPCRAAFFHNSWKGKAAQILVNKWVNIYTIGYYSTLKRRKSICYNIIDPWGHYFKWNKPVTKRPVWLNEIFYANTYVKHFNKETSIWSNRLNL